MMPPAPAMNRGPAPWGLLGMIALVLAIEGYVSRHEFDFTRPEGVEWRLSGQAARRPDLRGTILCFGSSMVKQGLLPRVVGRELGQPVYNLAMCGGPAPANYFLLRRALESGAKPAAILVEYHPGGLAVDQAHFASYWPSLLEVRELASLGQAAGDPLFFAESVVAKLLHTVRNRHELREHVQGALQGEARSFRRHNLPLQRNVQANRGAKVIPKNPAFQGEIAPHLRQTLLDASWSCNRINAVYIQRFLELAKQRQIPVFWIIPPFSPDLQREREQTGLDARYRQFVAGWQARFPNLTVLDGLRSGYQNSTFTDAMHFDWQGAYSFSADVAAVVGKRLVAPDDGRRWLALPTYRDRAAEVLLEDFAQSVAIVNQPKSTRR
ncbi:Protein of unknown function [Singulisphaera sp. GP187]|uniref:DUF1574 family protein n=1 Tax=Singulisphaera sp. GP187 TaxID=1882752 RepID=UPI00092807BC|nr:DUF1574 family protein [Singulisphaera sp. GP187]SIN81403.1 Protein of unknown function [Singulisphaera sp. GP187]